MDKPPNNSVKDDDGARADMASAAPSHKGLPHRPKKKTAELPALAAESAPMTSPNKTLSDTKAASIDIMDVDVADPGEPVPPTNDAQGASIDTTNVDKDTSDVDGGDGLKVSGPQVLSVRERDTRRWKCRLLPIPASVRAKDDQDGWPFRPLASGPLGTPFEYYDTEPRQYPSPYWKPYETLAEILDKGLKEERQQRAEERQRRAEEEKGENRAELVADMELGEVARDNQGS